jgi:hypothetical protein
MNHVTSDRLWSGPCPQGSRAVVGGQLGIGVIVNTLITKQSPKRSK